MTVETGVETENQGNKKAERERRTGKDGEIQGHSEADATVVQVEHCVVRLG